MLHCVEKKPEQSPNRLNPLHLRWKTLNCWRFYAATNLTLHWRQADKAIQQLGRVHRSNQKV